MSDRLYKINELIKEEVGKMIQREIDVESGLATIKAVDTTADLHYSNVWISYLGNNEKEYFEKLEGKKREIQKDLNHKLTMKYVPLIVFKVDHSGEYVETIEEVIKSVR